MQVTLRGIPMPLRSAMYSAGMGALAKLLVGALQCRVLALGRQGAAPSCRKGIAVSCGTHVAPGLWFCQSSGMEQDRVGCGVQGWQPGD